jgi:multiple sugar transport system substrate-binding protein
MAQEATMPDRDFRTLGLTPQLSRREFLRTAAAGTGALVLGAAAAAATPALPAAAAPAKPQIAPFSPKQVNLSGVTLSFLQWASFIPTADAFLKRQIEEGFMQETGATVTVEFVNANDIQAKTSAAIQAGVGPDVISFRDNWAHTYKESMSDISDLVTSLKQTQFGDFYAASEACTNVDGRYLAMPHDAGGGIVHWRKGMFASAGATSYPQTYADLHTLGKTLKDQGYPLGQAFGHSFGDPPGWCYSMMWGYGGQEVDASGRVAVNSAATIRAVADMKQAFYDAYDETGLAWDDGSNNRAFLAETISSTLNGSSIWFVARQDNVPFFDDIGLDPVPAGPSGRALLPGLTNYVIPAYSRNLEAGKELIRWLMRADTFTPRFLENQSYIGGISARHDAELPWSTFPATVQVFKDIGTYARTLGWPGPPNQKAGLAWSKYIIVDMFARAIQGDTPEAAVAWAETELKAIYEA